MSNLSIRALIIAKMLLAQGIESNPGPHVDNGSSTSLLSSGSSTSYEDPSDSTNFKCIHLNAQSVGKKMAKLTAEVSGYDVIGLSETWCNEETKTENITMDGYHKPVRKDRDSRGGGVAVYVKSTYIMKPMPELDVPGLEAIWVKVNNGIRNILIGVFYREPRSRKAYWDKIEESIEQAKLTGIPDLFIMGDLNDNQLQPRSKLLKMSKEFHLEQLIKEPTHKRALIDVILTSSPDMVERSGVVPQSLSEHKAVFAELRHRPLKQRSYKRKMYVYNRADWQGLKD